MHAWKQMKEIKYPMLGKAHILLYIPFVFTLLQTSFSIWCNLPVPVQMYSRYIEWAWMTWGSRDKCSVSCRSYQLKPGSMYDWSNYWARGIQFRTAVRWALLINALLIIFFINMYLVCRSFCGHFGSVLVQEIVDIWPLRNVTLSQRDCRVWPFSYWNETKH